MFFQRLAAKTDLVNTVVAQTHGLPDSLNGLVSDMLVGICEVHPLFSLAYGGLRGIEHLLSDERSLVEPLYALQAIRLYPASMRCGFLP